jgi:hypothetical protein
VRNFSSVLKNSILDIWRMITIKQLIKELMFPKVMIMVVAEMVPPLDWG